MSRLSGLGPMTVFLVAPFLTLCRSSVFFALRMSILYNALLCYLNFEAGMKTSPGDIIPDDIITHRNKKARYHVFPKNEAQKKLENLLSMIDLNQNAFSFHSHQFQKLIDELHQL